MNFRPRGRRGDDDGVDAGPADLAGAAAEASSRSPVAALDEERGQGLALERWRREDENPAII
jgi:hypothetical protein